MGPRHPARARIGIRVLDAVIIAVVLGGSGLLAWSVYSDNGAAPVLHVKTEAGEWNYMLNQDREIAVRGPLGETRIVISRGAAHISASACPEKTCLRFPYIKRNGQWSACLPNKVLLSVAGSRGAGYDAESF